jgi:hypothetical protein
VVDFDGADCAVGHRAGVGGNAEEVAKVVPDAATIFSLAVAF